MIRFKQFIAEGGNIEAGGVQAAPFKVTAGNRHERAKDIHDALDSLHNSFHTEHGLHLFGRDKKALKSGSIYAGSSKHLMNKKIGDEDFARHKPKVGDVDVQIPKDHGDLLASHLKPGSQHGKYTVRGIKKHGNDITAVMTHANGEHHQFDFEKSHYEHDEPTKGEQFLHSSDWEDTKKGVKGQHHKVLINATGGDTHKFSITHGLKSREDTTKNVGVTDPKGVSHALFGKDADHSKIHSFHGVIDLIKHHIPKAQHQAIVDKFSAVSKRDPGEPAHAKAFAHIKKELGVSPSLKESADAVEHHTSVIPLVGFSPISHMGHAHDLGAALGKLHGTKHVGMSKKADAFKPEERQSILSRQWGDHGAKVHLTSSGGDTVARAYHGLPKHGKKVLHILVGHDRKEFAHKLKDSLEAGKIPEMNGGKFDAIHIHHPEDSDRSHGLSGTNMRKAASEGDHETFAKHLGPMFSNHETKTIMGRVKGALDSGSIKVKRAKAK
jgi:hypothetical protein